VQCRLGDVSGGVLHRSSRWLDLVVSVWLDVLTRPKVDGGCRMGARRVDRETAESVAVIAGIGSFPEQVDYGMPITRIRYGSVAGDAWPSQSSRAASAPLIPLGLLAAAVVIIFALLRMVTRESSLYLSMHRERGC
jgi:hypothetical protein